MSVALSSEKNNDQFTSTWHNSSSAVTCAKLWPDEIIVECWELVENVNVALHFLK